MRNFLKPSIWAAFALGLSALFYACSQDDLTEASSTVAEEDFTVRVKNGYLEFKDQATLDSLKAQLEGKSREELDAWESQFKGFTSLRSLDEQSVDAQESWFEELRNMPETERLQLMRSDEKFWYSDFIKQHGKLFSLQDSGIYELKKAPTSANLLGFLNKESIYKIGNEIHVYQNNALKIITDGDESKIRNLESISETKEDFNVKVINFTEVPFNGSETINGRQQIAVTTFVGGGQSCEDVEDRDRVTGEVAITNYGDGSGIWTQILEIGVTNWYRDGLFGGYTRKRTREMGIVGDIDVTRNGAYWRSYNINVRGTSTLVTQLNRTATLSTSTLLYNFAATGDLDVFGRGGTHCGDTAPDTNCNDGNGCDIWR